MFVLFYFSLPYWLTTICSSGNWDPKTQESRYSSKIPTAALRVIAGFEADELHWNPRTSVEPPESLQKMMFPWIEEELEKVFAAVENDDKDRSTAIATLRLWQYLRKVILQDAAAMIIEFPERREHTMWRLPVFQTPEFEVSFFCF